MTRPVILPVQLQMFRSLAIKGREHMALDDNNPVVKKYMGYRKEVLVQWCLERNVVSIGNKLTLAKKLAQVEITRSLSKWSVISTFNK